MWVCEITVNTCTVFELSVFNKAHSQPYICLHDTLDDCVCAYVHACVCVCVCACMHAHMCMQDILTLHLWCMILSNSEVSWKRGVGLGHLRSKGESLGRLW